MTRYPRPEGNRTQHGKVVATSNHGGTMLSIHYGDRDDVIYDTSTFFDYSYSPSWLQDPLSQRIIKSIDNGTVLGANAIDTKVLGVIPPEKLSTGTKTLLLMLFMPQNLYNASTCGDNCAYWILRIASKHDITINLYHMMDFGKGRFTVRVTNTGQIVHTMDELILISAKCLREARA
jgi:hypothetical protein